MGSMRFLIDKLIEEKAQGNSFQKTNVEFKLLVKGINTKGITDETPDDPEILAKIFEVAEGFNINLKALTQNK